jgi:addiction module HigA family antidote
MRPKARVPTHPGEILREEFLRPLGHSSATLAAHLKLSRRSVSEILRGKKRVTPPTAWLLSQALGTTPEFWLNLQIAHDLAAKRPKRIVQRLRKVS